MPEYLTPGVDVEEVRSGPKPIEGVNTSVAGFLGPTERGPQSLRAITSWQAYQRWFGGHLGVAFSYLSYAVQGFFSNGGPRCFVGRIVAATATHATQNTTPNLTVTALGAGDWGNRIVVRVRPATPRDDHDTPRIRLQIAYFTVAPPTPVVDFTDPANASHPERRTPNAFEDFDHLSLDPTDLNFLLTTVNTHSHLVRVAWSGRPLMRETSSDFEPCRGGTDGARALTAADYEGDAGLAPINGDATLFGQGQGFRAMAQVNEVALLLAPDEARFGAELSSLIVQQCEQLQDRFGILATPIDFDVAHARPTHDTAFAAQYYPWLTVYDPVTRAYQWLPPSGHIAGIFARTDLQQGVHHVPANALVMGAIGLQKPVSQADQAVLNPVGINCLRDFRSDGRGLRVWGARTMSSDPEWRYVNVRRFFIFLVKSLAQGTQWVVFEPNTPPTWAGVQQAVVHFLTTLWRQGALRGNTTKDAFFVRCDSTTMAPDDIAQGRLICDIGVALVRPAEFVIVRLGRQTAAPL